MKNFPVLLQKLQSLQTTNTNNNDYRTYFINYTAGRTILRITEPTGHYHKLYSLQENIRYIFRVIEAASSLTTPLKF